MKEKIYTEALKNWNECFRLKIYDISFLDILEQMYKTTKSPMRAGIINELINEEINR
jgi:hypothetical protein